MSRNRPGTQGGPSAARRDRLLAQREHDTYGLKGKLPDPTACPDCGASYQAGRWSWQPVSDDARQTRCPACRRLADDYPAGVVRIDGAFWQAHREEIEGLARNLEEREKAEHPLKRIMRMVEAEDGSLEITTTDAHLARGIGVALHDAYEGELDYRFTDGENLFRVRWTR